MEHTCTSCFPRLKIHLASNAAITVPGLCTAGKWGGERRVPGVLGYKADASGCGHGEGHGVSWGFTSLWMCGVDRDLLLPPGAMNPSQASVSPL